MIDNYKEIFVFLFIHENHYYKASESDALTVVSVEGTYRACSLSTSDWNKYVVRIEEDQSVLMKNVFAPSTRIWLRSPANNNSSGANVFSLGQISRSALGNTDALSRPAMWISIQ